MDPKVIVKKPFRVSRTSTAGSFLHVTCPHYSDFRKEVTNAAMSPDDEQIVQQSSDTPEQDSRRNDAGKNVSVNFCRIQEKLVSLILDFNEQTKTSIIRCKFPDGNIQATSRRVTITLLIK